VSSGGCPDDCSRVSEPVSGAVPAVNSGEPGHVNASVALFRFRDGNQDTP
jgi:hypothetical protein